MPSDDRSEALGLAELMADRRTELPFRLGVGGALLAGTFVLLGGAPILIWGAAYFALQGAETILFPRPKLANLHRSRVYQALALATLAANVAVFTCIPLIELNRLGLWFMAYGEALVACAFLNIALTTHRSKTAFLVSMAPGTVYLVLFPILASRMFGCPAVAATATAAIGLGLVYGTVKLWTQTGLAHQAERIARLELQNSVDTANKSRAFLDAILEYVPSILNVQDIENARIVLVNKAMQDTAGRTRAQLVGAETTDVTDPAVTALRLEAGREAWRSAAPVKIGPFPVLSPQGWRLLRTTKIPILGLDRPYVLSVSEDVTEQQAIADAQAEAAEALTQALARAEAANEAKSAFLATMSHEIRTPLNGVLGMVQAMAADALTPVQRERLAVVHQSGQTLLAILNDVLDISKIEAGRLELEKIEFSLSAVAAGCQAAFSNVATSKGLAFTFAIDDEARGIYVGDPTRLRQILYNLLSNAMKFTECGEVSVRMSRHRDDLIVSVRDSGVGMTADQTERLFQKFAQADASTTRKFGGTGLGLAIVRDLAIAMGGDISVSSGLGEGATFTVRLGLPWVGPECDGASADRADVAAEPPVGLEPLKVLVAEDNEINQLVIKTLLTQVGVTPTVVANGKLALDAWEGQRWDVIFMDVQMPVMDGPTATRQIRDREHALSRVRTPILALTANAMTHQIEDYLAAGMDGHIAKPIEAARLFEALEQAMTQAQALIAAA